MNHGSLFSGIGGFDLAAEWMGWTNIFQVEWDSYCQKVLKKNFPDTLRFGDIVEFNKMLINGKINTDADSNRWTNGNIRQSKAKSKRRKEFIDINGSGRMGHDIPRIDILTGGFPCQPFSHAGRRKGTDDSRYLWPEMLTTIRILKPTFVVGENVAGLTSMENDTPFEKWVQVGMESKNYIRRKYSRYIYRKRQSYILNEIIEDLERENYTVETFVIPACSVGAWHRRDRIWIIAYNDGVGRGNRSTPEPDKTQFKDRGLCRNVSKSTDSRIESMRGRENQTNDKSRDQDVPDTKSKGLQGEPEQQMEKSSKSSKDSEDVPNSYIQGSQGWNSGELQKCTKQQPVGTGNTQNNGSYWESEPDVGRVAHGISNRVHRLKGLGNAIVPQIAFELFKAIETVKTY